MPIAAVVSGAVLNQVPLHKNKYSLTPSPAKETIEATAEIKNTSNNGSINSWGMLSAFAMQYTLSNCAI